MMVGPIGCKKKTPTVCFCFRDLTHPNTQTTHLPTRLQRHRNHDIVDIYHWQPTMAEETDTQTHLPSSISYSIHHDEF
jgi:hypothetical protein